MGKFNQPLVIPQVTGSIKERKVCCNQLSYLVINGEFNQPIIFHSGIIVTL